MMKNKLKILSQIVSEEASFIHARYTETSFDTALVSVHNGHIFCCRVIP